MAQEERYSRTSQRLQMVRAVEIKMAQEQVTHYVHGMVPVVLGMGTVALVSCHSVGKEIDYLFRPSLFSSVVGGLLLALLYQSARIPDAAVFQARIHYIEKVLLFMRLISHVMFILEDSGSSRVFPKLVSLIWFPLSAASSCFSPLSYSLYLVCQNILVLFEFREAWHSNAPWILTSFVVAKFCWQQVYNQSKQMKFRMQLASAMLDIEDAAEVTTRDIFDRLCDASVIVSTDGVINESAPQLAAVLGKPDMRLEGRIFSSLVHSDDVSSFLGRFARYADDDNEGVQYDSVNLTDPFGQPVPVHIFYAHFKVLDLEPTLLLGISETWQPPKVPKRSRTRAGGVACRPGRVGAGTSSAIAPARLLEDVQAVAPPPLVLETARTIGIGTAARRRFSPRPGGVRTSALDE